MVILCTARELSKWDYEFIYFHNIYFDKIIYGKEDFMGFLEEALKVFGWKFSVVKSENISWQLGLKTYFKNGHLKVLNVLEGSAAYGSLVVKEDEILAINDFRIDNNLDHWLNYFENDQIVLKTKIETIRKFGALIFIFILFTI